MLEVDKILLGECSEVMSAFPDDCVDLTVTSPPYDNLRNYSDYIFPFKEIANQLFRVTKTGGVVVWVVGDATINGDETGTSFKQALYFKEIGFNLLDTMIYKKQVVGACGSPYCYPQAFEYMFVFSAGTPKTINHIRDVRNLTAQEKGVRVGKRSDKNGYGGIQKSIVVSDFRKRDNVWGYNVCFEGQSRGLKSDHPAKFPLSLAIDHISSWSNERDLILDPFIGSGTTAIAAIKLNRHYLGIEISPEYYEQTNRGVMELKSQTTIFESLFDQSGQQGESLSGTS